MIKQEESGSLYDFVGDNHAAPVTEKKELVREQNWQSANNERFKRGLPDHVKEAMTVTQKDLSFYAFTRFALKHPVRDNFEQQVNKAFNNQHGELEKGFDFMKAREKYIALYKNKME